MQLRWSDIVGQKEYFDLIEGDIFVDKICEFKCIKDFYYRGITIKASEIVEVLMKS